MGRTADRREFEERCNLETMSVARLSIYIYIYIYRMLIVYEQNAAGLRAVSTLYMGKGHIHGWLAGRGETQQ